MTQPASVENCPALENSHIVPFFFPRSFFLQSLGVGLLYWAVSKQRNDCCTGQAPGNERTVALVSFQATRGAGGPIQAMPGGSGGMWARNSLREGGMSGPSGDEGNGDGLAQGF